MRDLEQFKGATGKIGDKNLLEKAIREKMINKDNLNEIRRKKLLAKINNELDRIRSIVEEKKKEKKEGFIGSLDLKKTNITTFMVGVLLGGLCMYLVLNMKKG